jgi:hypothetical protein
MISESGYWEAKKHISALEQGYATRAMTAGLEYHKRKLWGYCDGMKICLRLLEKHVEQKTE